MPKIGENEPKSTKEGILQFPTTPEIVRKIWLY